MFSIRREQGRLAELAPVIRILAGDARRGGPWRPGLVSLLVELGMEDEARRELARVVAEGLDAVPRVALARLAHLPDRRLRGARRRGHAPRSSTPSSSRSPGANVMIGHLVACYGAADRYLGMLAATLGECGARRGALRARHGAQPAHGRGDVARPHRLRVRPPAADARGRPSATGPQALLGEAAALAERIGMPALLGRIRALGLRRAADRACPTGCRPARSQILRLVARGLSNREIGTTLFISEHTAANHIRSILRKTGCANRTEAASYAHRHGLVEA